ncbi:MAG: aminoglycoside phosphotransferase family protein [Alphaproteobacteria bacterium]
MSPKDLADKVGVATLDALPRDVSPREYFRGVKDGRNFIVMFYPNPDNKSREELRRFIGVGRCLSQAGIKTPEIYDLDEQSCYAVIEDLGTVSFGKALKTGIEGQGALYECATDVLKKLIPVRDDTSGGLLLYEESKIYENRRQLIDYYVAFKRGGKSPECLTHAYLNVWDEIMEALPPCPRGVVHGDFHLENLMFQDDKTEINRCALIDYQDAMNAPLPYDLVNLLEDARIDVPLDLRHRMITRYCADMSQEEKDVFLIWYRVLGTQFHGRVLGLFIKLAAEQNRDSYLIHIPRLQAYMRDALSDPVLAPLKSWFEKEGVDFDPLNDLHGDEIRTVFKDILF